MKHFVSSNPVLLNRRARPQGRRQ